MLKTLLSKRTKSLTQRFQCSLNCGFKEKLHITIFFFLLASEVYGGIEIITLHMEIGYLMEKEVAAPM